MNMQGVRVLVTGGAGFIGSHLVDSLVRQGAMVRILDNFSSGLRENLANVLDDVEIELHPGVVVYVPRGVRHKAKGNLTVLTVCVPRGVLGDVHEME